MKRLTTNIFGSERCTNERTLSAAQLDRHVQAWARGNQAMPMLTAYELVRRGLQKYFGKRRIHSNMGSRFIFCSSQEGLCS